MSLKAQITDDMKTAMRAKDAQRLSAIRMLLAALKQKEIDERVELSDADVLAIVEKELKKRRDSIAQYQQAGRQDLVAIEEFEVGVLSGYMPQQLSESEVADAVTQAIVEVGAQGAKDMGKVMAVLKPKLAGRADMTKVSSIVKGKLAG
jgi:uncharacterized protein